MSSAFGDIALPSEFSATQTYEPLSSGFTIGKYKNWKIALTTTVPSLSHVIEGVGEPVTVQVRLIAWPALPVIADGGSTIVGGVLVITARIYYK